jgi:hypothetical protein
MHKISLAAISYCGVCGDMHVLKLCIDYIPADYSIRAACWDLDFGQGCVFKEQERGACRN